MDRVDLFFPRLGSRGVDAGGNASVASVNNQREAVEEEIRMEETTQHDGYYVHLKRKVAERMAEMCGADEIPKTREDVCKCLACAFDSGTSGEVAEMQMLVTEWLHACHELHEHK